MAILDLKNRWVAPGRVSLPEQTLAVLKDDAEIEENPIQDVDGGPTIEPSVGGIVIGSDRRAKWAHVFALQWLRECKCFIESSVALVVGLPELGWYHRVCEIHKYEIHTALVEWDHTQNCFVQTIPLVFGVLDDIIKNSFEAVNASKKNMVMKTWCVRYDFFQDEKILTKMSINSFQSVPDVVLKKLTQRQVASYKKQEELKSKTSTPMDPTEVEAPASAAHRPFYIQRVDEHKFENADFIAPALLDKPWEQHESESIEVNLLEEFSQILKVDLDMSDFCDSCDAEASFNDMFVGDEKQDMQLMEYRESKEESIAWSEDKCETPEAHALAKVLAASDEHADSPCEELVVEAAKQLVLHDRKPITRIRKKGRVIDEAKDVCFDHDMSAVAASKLDTSFMEIFADWRDKATESMGAMLKWKDLSTRQIGDNELSLVQKESGSLMFVHWVDIARRLGKSVSVDEKSREIKAVCNAIHPTMDFKDCDIIIPAIGSCMRKQKFKGKRDPIVLLGTNIDLDELPKVDNDVLLLKKIWSRATAPGISISPSSQCCICESGAFTDGDDLGICSFCCRVAHVSCNIMLASKISRKMYPMAR